MNNPNRSLSVNLGFLKGITRQLKLIGRLMVDGRVHPALKLLPLGAILYLLVPTDLVPLLPLDDAAILWLGGSMFIELCPRPVVDELLLRINGEDEVDSRYQPHVSGAEDPEIIDAEFKESHAH